eukprot:CAMPEP_0206319004 /NCGR_PEP_ID=MMETSP0106_2-20121207/17520_1 /ASSEMBLY_ACC=CAM_ASM_000206 /TAXON_ID=81532 /ORGANISM="Acanthoeca-like sp., Strain 10tr" /LENGTH=310 /DNA_ID=CAMNT_0053750799 /DNA_START=104 /DNA_END=1035 /DNA_ORIENTATION=+
MAAAPRFESVPQGESGVRRLFDLYRAHGAADYIGEPISQTSHACQAGMLAELSGCPPDVCVGAFLHDVGHLLSLDDELGDGLEMMGDVGVLNHEGLGADIALTVGLPVGTAEIVRLHDADIALTVGLPVGTAEIIRNHINAKRWLVTTREGYHDKLSDASKETFKYQGGKMSDAERKAFEESAHFKTHIQMRQWDEAAKDDSEHMAKKIETQYNVNHWEAMALALLKYESRGRRRRCLDDAPMHQCTNALTTAAPTTAVRAHEHRWSHGMVRWRAHAPGDRSGCSCTQPSPLWPHLRVRLAPDRGVPTLH